MRATEIAGQELLEMLRINSMCYRTQARPDGLLRGLVFDPNENSTHVVWVVTYCRDDAARPGDCPTWHTYMIDDQTGERVTSFSQNSVAHPGAASFQTSASSDLANVRLAG